MLVLSQGSSPGDVSKAAALVLAVQEFVANGGGRPRSAPPQCCIAGADGQSWPCRSAWLVAFQLGSDVVDVVDACSRARATVRALAGGPRQGALSKRIGRAERVARLHNLSADVLIASVTDRVRERQPRAATAASKPWLLTWKLESVGSIDGGAAASQGETGTAGGRPVAELNAVTGRVPDAAAPLHSVSGAPRPLLSREYRL